MEAIKLGLYIHGDAYRLFEELRSQKLGNCMMRETSAYIRDCE